MFISGKPLQPCPFKDPYLFHRTSRSNICLKSSLLNTQKYLKPPHFLLVNALVCSFTTAELFTKYIKFFRGAIVDICSCKGEFAICSCELLLSPKELLFRSTYSLNFPSGYEDLGNIYLTARYFEVGYMEQISFDSSCLLRTNSFLEDLSHPFNFFKESLLTSPLPLQLYIP